MSQIMSLAKATLKWAAIVLEALAGILLLAVLDRMWGHRASASDWFLLAVIALFGFSSVIASATAIRNAKRAGLLLLFLTPFGLAVSFLTQIDRLHNDMIVWYVLLWYSFLATLILLLAPALFWLAMYRTKWAPVMSQGEALSPKRRITRFAWVVSVVLVLVLIASVVLEVGATSIGFDCGKVPISRFNAGQVVFVGKVIRTLGPCESHSVRRYCYAAVALVSERFWGMSSKVALLTSGYFEDGETYLIDGVHADGPLTRLIPFVQFQPCNETARVEDATVNLRVLRGGIPITGVRIIGEVTRHNGKKWEAAPEIDVVIDGPAGRMTAITDKEGIYDVGGLPPGNYQIRTGDGSPDFRHRRQCSYWALKSGDVGGCRLFVE